MSRSGIYTITRRLLGIAALLAVVLLSACSGGRKFKVSGSISGNKNTNLYMKYYANDAVQTTVTASREGKFEALGTADRPAIVEILDNEYRVLATFLVEGGEKLQIDINPANPYSNKISGSEINERWAKLLGDNADMLLGGDTKKINDFVEQYIKANPDDVLGTMLFVTLYDASANPIHADEVMDKISPKARLSSLLDPYATMAQRVSDAKSYASVKDFKYRVAKSDSARTFSPSKHDVSLIAVSDEHSNRVGKIVPRLKEIYSGRNGANLEILDIALYNDTMAWRRNIERDSAKWTQGWVPGGILGAGLDELAIPSIPYYIVVDNDGKQKYRGNDLDKAESEIKRLIRK